MYQERLREDVKDYFGTAISCGYPMAIMELSEVESASYDRLQEIAIQNGFDLSNYENIKTRQNLTYKKIML